MALRTIVTEGYESLSKISKPVDNFDGRLEILINDMIDTVKNANGIGLAAPQIGILRRVAIVVDSDESVIVLVNPEIVEKHGEQVATEGCLSIPGVWGKTKRPAKVTIKAQDKNGKLFTLTREGITAVAFCHETDHLDGKLFRDKVLEYIEHDEKR
ncbi:MAG: peptide deformylase [Clostridia bacterium]|jgi:peptide deformylase|nr:peptide deformylase [Clostridia bacterium]